MEQIHGVLEVDGSIVRTAQFQLTATHCRQQIGEVAIVAIVGLTHLVECRSRHLHGCLVLTLQQQGS